MNNEFPMRINKYLAHTGHSTRLGADELIRSKKVLINGKLAVLGDKVNQDDEVTVLESHRKNNFLYFAYNKKVGIVTANPQKNEKDILDSIKIKTKVFPVGRLDKDSEGLIILTNDGRITDRLLNPENHHEKEYLVVVDKPISNIFIKKMSGGLDLGDFKTRKATVKQHAENSFSIILTEGKNRQIRRMVEKLDYKVLKLKRIRIQNILLGTLPLNSLREIQGKERSIFLKSLGL